MPETSHGRPRMTEAEFAYLERLAAAAADSGLYGAGNRTKAQLLMKLIYGRDLGIPVSAALSGIDIYDGKMELSSNLIAALIEAHPHYAYAIVETSNERCELEFFKDGASLGSATFDTAAAITAGLADTDYYRQFPSDMLFARAVTRGARRYCPGLGRGVAIYATGELAKRTPEPTRQASTGEGVARASAADARTIRSLAAAAGLGDAELFNVIVTTAGGKPQPDAARAAQGLGSALERLPVTFVGAICQTLRERARSAAEAPARNGAVDGDLAARAAKK